MHSDHPSIQLLTLGPSALPIPSVCRSPRSVVTAVRRDWVSHSFPRPIIAGKGRTLSFSQRGNHGSLHVWCYKSWGPESKFLDTYSSKTTFCIRALASGHLISRWHLISLLINVFNTSFFTFSFHMDILFSPNIHYRRCVNSRY